MQRLYRRYLETKLQRAQREVTYLRGLDAHEQGRACGSRYSYWATLYGAERRVRVLKGKLGLIA